MRRATKRCSNTSSRLFSAQLKLQGFFLTSTGFRQVCSPASLLTSWPPSATRVQSSGSIRSRARCTMFACQMSPSWTACWLCWMTCHPGPAAFSTPASFTVPSIKAEDTNVTHHHHHHHHHHLPQLQSQQCRKGLFRDTCPPAAYCGVMRACFVSITFSPKFVHQME